VLILTVKIGTFLVQKFNTEIIDLGSLNMNAKWGKRLESRNANWRVQL